MSFLVKLLFSILCWAILFNSLVILSDQTHVTAGFLISDDFAYFEYVKISGSKIAEPIFAPTKKIMIFAPHPDDETLMAAGVIETEKNAGNKVDVVIVSNGDFKSVDAGMNRINESLSALEYLGLNINLDPTSSWGDNVMFLGYPDDKIDDLYYAKDNNHVYNNNSKALKTYGNKGYIAAVTSYDYTGIFAKLPKLPVAPLYKNIGVDDYHFIMHAKHAKNTQSNIKSDIYNIIFNAKPNDIFVTSKLDTHPDHQATYFFVVDAINKVRQASNYNPKLHEGIVHGGNEKVTPPHWPTREMKFNNSNLILSQLLGFNEPDSTKNRTDYLWTNREKLAVPSDMQTSDLSRNRKYQAILRYPSQHVNFPEYSYSFVKSDEFFWVTQFTSNSSYNVSQSIN